jgi:DNA primase
MPLINYHAARSQLRLADVLTLAGFTPFMRRGASLRGACPVHRSRRPQSRSFAADVERNVWHCFACGAGGNALDLWVALTGQPLYQAVLDLCARLGQEVPWLPRRPGQRPRPAP